MLLHQTKKSVVRLLSAQQKNIFGRPSTEFWTAQKLWLLLPLLCPAPTTFNFLSAGSK
jgi:hypothetical protein